MTVRQPQPVDILAAMRREHRRMKDEVCALRRREQDRAEALDHLREGITRYARSVETVLYDCLIERGGPAAMVGREGYVEHDLLTTLLQHLDHERDKAGEEWHARLRVLGELLQHHFSKEERLVFGAIEQAFGPEEQARLSQRFEQSLRQAGMPG